MKPDSRELSQLLSRAQLETVETLTWKAGSKPVLITSDNQVNKLEKTSGLTERPGKVVLNCPIVRVGK
jgi:hypothetical protein